MGYGADIEDIGADYAERDFEEIELEELEELRNKRLRNLIGKYVITCIGNKSNKECYLQDRNISKSCWWTYFLANAIGYESKIEAEKKCSQLKYNNCKVKLIK